MIKMKLAIIYSLIVVTFFHKSYESRITVKEKYGVGNSLTISNNENGGVNCTGIVGSICSDRSEDCGSVFMCLSGTSFIEVDCPEGQTCNADRCSTDKTHLCEYKNLTFKCTTEGMYPEPSSCKKYNYCLPTNLPETPVDPTPVNGTCPTGWRYYTYNTLCSKMLIDDNCEETDRVVPACKENGQIGTVNAGFTYHPYYYICSPYSKEDPTLYPFISKCPDNQDWNEDKGMCK